MSSISGKMVSFSSSIVQKGPSFKPSQIITVCLYSELLHKKTTHSIQEDNKHVKQFQGIFRRRKFHKRQPGRKPIKGRFFLCGSDKWMHHINSVPPGIRPAVVSGEQYGAYFKISIQSIPLYSNRYELSSAITLPLRTA
jgi:hypothetical protein